MAPPSNFHENYSAPEKLETGSDRSFGIVFFIFFAIVGLWPLRREEDPRIWAIALAGAFLLAALARPGILHPLNRLWMKFGLLLNSIVSPVIFGILFYFVITPFGLFIRLSGSDPLRRKRDPAASTYWISRDPPGPEPQSLRHQF